MDSLMGIPIVADPYCPKTIREQFRFPRSHKKRIAKKWKKRAKNFREVTAMFLINGYHTAHPEVVGLIKNFALEDSTHGR